MNPLFVNLEEVAPYLLFDLKYAQSDNFLGRPAHGYEHARCLITSAAADGIVQANNALRPLNLCLKVFDAYRPQHTVDDFVRWAKSPGHDQSKHHYFPDVLKADLIAQGYIAAKSSHSRGSSIDLTLCVRSDATDALVAGVRLPVGEIDMGTCFDYFGPESHTDSRRVSVQAQANRRLLQKIMNAAGFEGIQEEWWHFTLRDEPFPSTYFDFPLSAS